MSYVDRNLLERELVLYRARLSRTVFAWPGILLLVAAGLPLLGGAAPGLGLVLALVALGYALRAWMRYAGAEFAVTSERVIMKTGFIRRHALEIMLDQVSGLVVEQGLLGRLFDFGSVWVIGAGGARDAFERLADPLRFRQAVQQQLARRAG